MEIRLRSNGAVMTESELRRYCQENGGPSWGQTTPEVLEALDADPVFEGPQAQPTRYQTAFRDGVEEIEGKWYTKYSVADMSDEAKVATDEATAKSVREQRNQKLKECDWTQLADAPVDRDAWAAYRAGLRSVPEQLGFPWDVTWPAQPE
jgi:Phage tail assembly chaperone protein